MATELDAALIAHFEACGLVTIEQLSQSVTIQAHRAPQRHTNLDVVVAQPAGASTGRDQLPRLTRTYACAIPRLHTITCARRPDIR